MKLAMRLPERSRHGAGDSDPRDEASAEVIDLATRMAYPAVTQRKGRSDALGMAAGVGIVAVLGAATLWGLNASRMEQSAPAAQPDAGPLASPMNPAFEAPTPAQEAAMASALPAIQDDP